MQLRSIRKKVCSRTGRSHSTTLCEEEQNLACSMASFGLMCCLINQDLVWVDCTVLYPLPEGLCSRK